MGKYSKDSALIESTLILIIVAVLAGATLHIYKTNKNTSETLENSSGIIPR